MLRPSDYEPGLGGAVLEAELDADFAAFNDWLFAQRGVRVAPQPAYEVVMQYTVAELEANWALVQLYMQDMSVTAGTWVPGGPPLGGNYAGLGWFPSGDNAGFFVVNTCNPFILGHEWAHSVRAPHSLGYFVDTGTRFDDDWTASLMAGPPLSEYHTGDIEHMILADETWEAIKGEWE